MKNLKLINLLCLCGVISIVFYLLHDIIGAINYPGYNWMSQAVSDLTAADAKSFVVASGFTTVYKILHCLALALVCILVKDERKSLRAGIYLYTLMGFISSIGYALFPLSSAGYDGSVQSFIHVYVITIIVVLLSIISLVIIAIGAFKSKYKLLGILAIISLCLMFIGAVGSQIVPKEIFGIIERFSTYSAVIFNGVLGIFGFLKNDEKYQDNKIVEEV